MDVGCRIHGYQCEGLLRYCRHGILNERPRGALELRGWTDLNGNLWLFGGQGFDSTGNGTLNDLWEFKGGQWIWQKGPKLG